MSSVFFHSSCINLLFMLYKYFQFYAFVSFMLMCLDFCHFSHFFFSPRDLSSPWILQKWKYIIYVFRNPQKLHALFWVHYVVSVPNLFCILPCFLIMLKTKNLKMFPFHGIPDVRTRWFEKTWFKINKNSQNFHL